MLAVAAALVMAGCTGQVVVRDYGKDAKANFVGSCTENLRIENEKRVTETLAPKSFCTCVYEAIDENTDKHHVPWDDLTDYERKVEKAKAGKVPDPPEQLQAAIDSCRKQGPSPEPTSSVTSTTAGSN